MSDIQWFYRSDEDVLGPHSSVEIQRLFNTGVIDANTYVYDDKSEEWTLFSEKVELLNSISIPAPPTIVASDDVDTGESSANTIIRPTASAYFIEGIVIPWPLIILRKPVSEFLIDSGIDFRIFGKPITLWITILIVTLLPFGYTMFKKRPTWWSNTVAFMTVTFSIIWMQIIR